MINCDQSPMKSVTVDLFIMEAGRYEGENGHFVPKVDMLEAKKTGQDFQDLSELDEATAHVFVSEPTAILQALSDT